jgi:hypothetical protein
MLSGRKHIGKRHDSTNCGIAAQSRKRVALIQLKFILDIAIFAESAAGC